MKQSPTAGRAGLGRARILKAHQDKKKKENKQSRPSQEESGRHIFQKEQCRSVTLTFSPFSPVPRSKTEDVNLQECKNLMRASAPPIGELGALSHVDSSFCT